MVIKQKKVMSDDFEKEFLLLKKNFKRNYKKSKISFFENFLCNFAIFFLFIFFYIFRPLNLLIIGGFFIFIKFII